jgi:hypothetical protein
MLCTQEEGVSLLSSEREQGRMVQDIGVFLALPPQFVQQHPVTWRVVHEICRAASGNGHGNGNGNGKHTSLRLSPVNLSHTSPRIHLLHEISIARPS